MPTAPADDLRRLLDLQALDSEAQLYTHRRSTHPTLEAIAALQARELELEEALVAKATDVSDLRRELTKAEDDVQAVRDRMDRDTARLQSGQGTPKDLQALQSEVETLTKRRSDLEDLELGVMEKAEAAESALDEARAQIEEVRSSLMSLAAERDSAFADLDGELARISREREPLAASLDSALLSLYEKLRASHGGVGAAALRDGQCTGCHVRIDNAFLASIATEPEDTILRCEECGRILVREG